MRSANVNYMQYVACFAATLSAACDAMYIAWTSPTLPKLTSSDSPIGVTITPREASWIASSMYLSCFVSIFLSHWLTDGIGRKNTLFVAAFPLFLPWIIIIFAKSAITIIIARIIGSIGGQIAIVSTTVYIGEVAGSDNRGKLGMGVTMFKLLGSLYVLSVGPFISYTALAVSSSILPIIFAVAIFPMPESPYYLVRASKPAEAKRNLKRLLNKNTSEIEIDDQIALIQKNVKQNMESKTTVWEFISKPEYRKAMFIMFAVVTFQQLSGVSTISAYMQTIVQDSESSITPEVSSIIFGVIQIPAVLLAAFLIDKIGRRPLMMVSCFGCAVSLTAEAIYFYLEKVAQTNVESISWFPTTFIVLFLILNPIGLNTLPYVLLSELFPINIKIVAINIYMFYGSLVAFITVLLFEPIASTWGMHVVFGIYAVMCMLGFFFTLFILPETKGRTFADIQKLLYSEKK